MRFQGLQGKTKHEELEIGLAANPANAQRLNTHSSYDIELLKQLWSTASPPKVRHLNLTLQWWDKASPEQIRTCIESKNESTVETLVVEVRRKTPEVSRQTLFSVLDRFDALTKLEIVSAPSKITFTPDLSEIHCPNLKFLVLHSTHTSVQIDNNLPNLERFEIHRSIGFLEEIDDNSEEAELNALRGWWDMLSQLMVRGILFRCGCKEFEPMLLLAVPQIADSVKAEPGPLSRWLIQCERDVQVNEGRKSISYSLERFGLPAAALRQIKDLNFAESLDIIFRIHETQAQLLDIANSFPTNITSLTVHVSEHIIEPPFTDIIRQLPQLEKFTLCLFSVTDGHMAVFPCRASCTSKTCLPTFHYLLRGYAKTVDLVGGCPEYCEMLLDRGGEARWESSESRNGLFRAYGKEDAISFHVPEFENELMGWFDLNPKLSSIRMIYEEVEIENPNYIRIR
jgi:hypothetical protein